MSEKTADSAATMTLPQGDLRLLDSDVAKRLLTSTVPARFAYIAMDGTPRVVPTWFHWTGDELVMPTFVSAPHERHAAARLGPLRANPDVAITIDTEGFPPIVLSVRGRAAVTEVDGVVAAAQWHGRRDGLSPAAPKPAGGSACDAPRSARSAPAGPDGARPLRQGDVEAGTRRITGRCRSVFSWYFA